MASIDQIVTNPNPNESFEFDAPQFQDFSNEENLNISEEYCQGYFTKKSDEIRRTSNQSQKSIPSNLQSDSDSDSDDDRNITPSNLVKSFIHQPIQSNHPSNLPRTHFDKKPKINLTTEELQLQEVDRKKQQLHKLQEENAKNVLKMRDSHNVFQPQRSIQLTIPISPALRTSVRAQKRSELNNNNNNSNNKNKENAKPRRYSLNTSISSNTYKAPNTPYKPLTTTIPQSFKLSKTNRKRRAIENNNMENDEHLTTEQKELKKIDNYHFKARKMNKKIFKHNAGNMGILNNIKNKKPTTIKPFNLSTGNRTQKHNQSLNE